MSLGYEYIKLNFYEPKDGLFKRFSLSNKPSIVKYDLYDNAEVLNLAIKFKDKELISSLDYSIKRHFILKGNIYSVIDLFNLKRNKNTLRWATLPYLYTLSKMNRALKS